MVEPSENLLLDIFKPLLLYGLWKYGQIVTEAGTEESLSSRCYDDSAERAGDTSRMCYITAVVTVSDEECNDSLLSPCQRTQPLHAAAVLYTFCDVEPFPLDAGASRIFIYLAQRNKHNLMERLIELFNLA